MLIVLDEADPGLVEATLAVVDQECDGADTLDAGLVDRWLGHRNDVSALAPLWRGGIVVDTVEVSARWSALPGLYRSVLDALAGVEGTLVASSHQSHAYTDGACLYFTFAGRPPENLRRGIRPRLRHRRRHRLRPGDRAGAAGQWVDRYYRRAWDEVTRATLERGWGDQPPPRHRAQPGPLPARPPSGPASPSWPRSRTPSIPTGSSIRASSV